jgi:hypothetical protein
MKRRREEKRVAIGISNTVVTLENARRKSGEREGEVAVEIRRRSIPRVQWLLRRHRVQRETAE